jgi:hypothetical protein
MRITERIPNTNIPATPYRTLETFKASPKKEFAPNNSNK